ncbi:MAG: triphosphoribosyl-dephospho-CoA synthase [Pirellulaceae bacterium]
MSETPAHACDAGELSIGQCATLACLLEVSTPKPGNVHRGADFEDMTFVDFAVSAVAIGPALEHAVRHGVGRTVWDAIQATRALVPTNTNLGTVLLLAPLAAVPRADLLQPGVQQVLATLTPLDSVQVYRAIRRAHPGGLGEVDAMDVAAEAPADLLSAMQAARERDLVARQYVTGFAVVFQEVLPWLLAGPGQGWSLADTIVHTQLRLLSRYGDSLIARKCGPALDAQVAVCATRALESGVPGDEAYDTAIADLDFWLRSDHHRRNPGTTADLLAAGLFAALRDGLLRPGLG